ncbi:MAG TPA: TetR family transcriptional regulator [Ktedonobacteraceae bacterium]|nr:TetR family transcriptional regulator [Ktedonobacteraceae bacterium]
MSDVRPRPDRRANLLAAARAILAEKGLEATTVSEIVARAGVAQGTFYLYFPSKYALIPALNQELNEQILTAVREATARASSALEVVRLGVSTVFQILESYRDVLYVIHSPMTMWPSLTDWEAQFGPYRELIIALIQQRQATGEIPRSINPDISARLIIGLINHAGDECFVYHTTAQPEIYIEEVIRFISRALGLKA